MGVKRDTLETEFNPEEMTDSEIRELLIQERLDLDACVILTSANASIVKTPYYVYFKQNGMVRYIADSLFTYFITSIFRKEHSCIEKGPEDFGFTKNRHKIDKPPYEIADLHIEDICKVYVKDNTDCKIQKRI